MPYDEHLAERLRPIMTGRAGVVEKRMFGGIGYLLQGNMLVGVWREYLVARLGIDEAERALAEPAVRPMDFTGKPMRGWVMVGPEGTGDESRLKSWVDRATRFVSTLPAK
ncbi:MAG: TfoX/Sxy family protein [Isosphaeraceae bacterium]|nr:TfoX/Sxy family protein [Isosphaeraceae bacterium]